MPINYKKYPSNWLSEIRPSVLNRAGDKCEICNVANYKYIFRGIFNGRKAFQDSDLLIYDAETGERITNWNNELIEPFKKGDINKTAIRIVLTVAHLDHDITNNSLNNLKALCQYHHLNYDKCFHSINRKETLKKKKGEINLFN